MAKRNTIKINIVGPNYAKPVIAQLLMRAITRAGISQDACYTNVYDGGLSEDKFDAAIVKLRDKYPVVRVCSYWMPDGERKYYAKLKREERKRKQNVCK